MIERTFQNIPEGKLSEADQQSFLVSLGWSRGTTWEDLLRSRRVLMISEAGAGKTYECRDRARRLWDEGEPAFFVELARLAAGDLLLEAEEEARLDRWLSSQSDVATFFLDSIDELKLSLGSFEQALKRLKKAIDGQLGRARIIMTTRPVPFDEELLRRLLPIPPVSSTEASEETFAKIAMRDHQTRQVGDKDDDAAPDWRTVGLMPLSDAQIVEFARGQGVEDPMALLDDLERRHAQEFSRRPQDLIELCADWREHKRIRTHGEQVAANVRVKLQPRDDRPEPAELSTDKAVEGASRLALAMLVTRRMTIRHSAALDVIKDEAALDPAMILSDWKPNERKALLERPLFGFASYGRVRFHHRSVGEYLAAERLRVLRHRGMTFRTLRRLLFAQTKGKTIVRPSKRPVAGWLALTEDGIFEMLRDNEPAVLLNEGDPETLSQPQRNQALRAYVERYGQGGWRGLRVPYIQVHRFASAELADIVRQLWNSGIENPEVREIILRLIEAGSIDDCADIAYGVARDVAASAVERMIAVDAMGAISDPRLKDIAAEVAAADALWPEQIARRVVPRLFPRVLSIDQLCQTLSWINEGKGPVGDLSWELERLIATAELDQSSLEALRDGLVALLSAGLRWQEDWPHIVCDRPRLSGVLAAACVRGLDGSKSNAWLHASVLALRLHRREHSDIEAHEALRKRLTNLSADESARLFWAADSLVQSLNAIANPWNRFAEVTLLHDEPVGLRRERDLDWIKEALGDTARSVDDRAMLLEAAMRLPQDRKQRGDHVSGLKPLVADQPSLVAAIEERLKPSKLDEMHERWKKEEAEREKQQERRDAENRTSWIQFWREVAEHPEIAFSSERSGNTAWNLWGAMSHDGEHGRVSGWNRRFIEEHFGTETADRLRRTLMNIWRKDHPTLPSERPEGERGRYLVRWRLALAGLYAEAEDPSWATKLTEEEAKLAARYAPIELNGLPHWMESLVDAHPGAVDAILGNELSWELRESRAHGHPSVLQGSNYASEPVAKLFLPRLWEWLNGDGDATNATGDLAERAERLRQVIHTMLKHDDEDTRARVLAVACKRVEDDLPQEFNFVWLPTLMRLDPDLGVSSLGDQLRTAEPVQDSEAVKWFSVLFGDRHDAINLRTPAFTPQLLLRLLRLAYHHVRPVDDAEHESTYSPDTRDYAERARHAIVNALLDAKGEEGWAAKLEMANDPLCAYFRDHILAVAEEHWAHEIDAGAFDETQAVELDKEAEAPASTNEEMFALMKDRVVELDELLLRDDSPREAWARITDEKVMRRAIARELRLAANGLYTVDQEAVTADEKETDIRLRSVLSEHEAVIELKLADRRSGSDLRDTIHDQLVTKYMAAENSRSGCLLVTLAKDRMWEHPDNGTLMDIGELVSLLRDEAERVEGAMGAGVALYVHLLDLRPRLLPENAGT